MVRVTRSSSIWRLGLVPLVTLSLSVAQLTAAEILEAEMGNMGTDLSQLITNLDAIKSLRSAERQTRVVATKETVEAEAPLDDDE